MNKKNSIINEEYFLFREKIKMEFSHLIGHKIKAVIFEQNNRRTEFIGYVSNVDIDIYGHERIYIKENKKNEYWFVPHHSNMREFNIKILDNEIKKYTKFTRFEIMEI